MREGEGESVSCVCAQLVIREPSAYIKLLCYTTIYPHSLYLLDIHVYI